MEEGTKLAYDIDHGRTPPPDPDLQAAMYEWSEERLSFLKEGYRQYEISNWARAGEECRHNLVYWRNGEWLGLGAGAHSHWMGNGKWEMGEAVSYRFADVYSPKQYVQRVQETVERGIDASAASAAALLKSMRQVAYSEQQRAETAMSDTAILALRLNEGLEIADFRQRFGKAPDEVFGPALDEMTAVGLLERQNGSFRGRIRLTPRGRLLANEVFVRLLPE